MKNIIIFSLLTCLSLPFAQANDSAEDIEAIADANDAGVGQMFNEMKDSENKVSKKNRLQKKDKKKKSRKAMSKEQQEEIIAKCKQQIENGQQPGLICKKFLRPAPELNLEAVLTEAMKSKAKGTPDYCHQKTNSQAAFERCMEGNPALVTSNKKPRKAEQKGNRAPAHEGGDHILTAE